MPDTRPDGQLASPAPVRVVETGSEHDGLHAPEKGIALCLSGGGYRAMLFHVGAMWRLNQFGYLPKLARISSVSGGSIAAATLGLKWPRLAFDANGVAGAFQDEVVGPIRALASTTVDAPAVIGGLLLPGSISSRIVAAYRRHLFGSATLQDLPADPPRFVINATNVQTGVLFRFSRPFLADYRVGMIGHPRVELAVAVAASSAFPPVLSPLELKFPETAWDPPSGLASEDLHRAPFLTNVVLADGGVYDNLGLETAWKRYDTILVSNGGGNLPAQPKPKRDWARHAVRITEIMNNQVISLHERLLIASFTTGERAGTYWGIRTDISRYGLKDALLCPLASTRRLAETPTRLKRLDGVTQERLINWGYAVCDAAMRTHVGVPLSHVPEFPFPASGVG